MRTTDRIGVHLKKNFKNQAVSVWIVLTVPDIRLNFNTPFPSVNLMESNLWTQAN